jgi:O-antigen/teichoic acid export membrane protein
MLTLSAFLLQQWTSGLAAVFTALKVVGYFAASISGLSLSTALAIDFGAYIFWYVGLQLAYRKYIPYPEQGETDHFSRPERRRVIRYATFYNFNDVGSLALSTRADYLFIAGFLSPVAVGAYAFATQLDTMLRKLMPVSFFLNVIQPLVFTLDYKTQKDRARQYFRFLVKLTFLFQLPVTILIVSVPTQLITVAFAGKFIEYSHVLVATFLFATIASPQVPVGLVAQLAERAGIVMLSKIFSIYNIVANVILIPRYGIMGAVIATGSANILKHVFIWTFVREVASFQSTGRFFINQVLVWLSCWAILATITPNVSPIVGVAVGLIVVAVCALIGLRLADFSDTECKLIRRVAGERISSVLLAFGFIR